MADYTFKKTAGDSYELAGMLNFETVPKVLAEAAGLFKQKTGLEIDLAGVSQANSAAMALLIEWKSLAAAAGSEIRFTNIPVQIEHLAKVCRIDDLLTS
ncbi:MAG: STAS domain-containing protein [Gammaproteobacteria bacterium]|nr:STAS domain-containing protein [Gammaproteobacteria bacterium]